MDGVCHECASFTTATAFAGAALLTAVAVTAVVFTPSATVANTFVLFVDLCASTQARTIHLVVLPAFNDLKVRKKLGCIIRALRFHASPHQNAVGARVRHDITKRGIS
jgi:hypothetical protein